MEFGAINKTKRKGASAGAGAAGAARTTGAAAGDAGEDASRCAWEALGGAFAGEGVLAEGGALARPGAQLAKLSLEIGEGREAALRLRHGPVPRRARETVHPSTRP
jgi:hypothetical protein